jgi:guanine deaminase
VRATTSTCTTASAPARAAAIYGHGIHLARREWRALASPYARSRIARLEPVPRQRTVPLGSREKARRPAEVGMATDVGGGTTLSFLRTLGEAYKVTRS